MRIPCVKLRSAAAAGLASLLATGCASTPPDTLGLKDGALAPCPPRPACVSSESDRPRHAIAPLHVEGEPERAWYELARAVFDLPYTSIRERTPSYMRAETQSRYLGFVDDLEFYLDRHAGVIHMRSSARLGYYDFDTNRQRLERVRDALRQARVVR